MDNKVLIVGRDGINILGLVRSFGEAGIKPFVICISPKLHLVTVAQSKYVQKTYIVKDDAACIEKMIELFKKEAVKPVVFTSGDSITYNIDLQYDVLKEYFILSNARNKQGEIVRLMDKEKMRLLAEKSGLLTPVSFIVSKNDDLSKINIKYPCITKSILSVYGGKQDVFICKNEDELYMAIQKVNSVKLQIQEFICKKAELIFCGLATRDTIIIPGVAENITTVRGYYSGYQNYKSVDRKYDNIIRKQIEFIHSCEYRGLFSIEYIIDRDDNCYFMEVNLRNDGYSYMVTAAGVNLPKIFYDYCTSSKRYNENSFAINKTTVMDEGLDYVQSVKTNKVTLLNWFKRVNKTDVLLFHNSKDIKPTICLLYIKLLLLLNRCLKVLVYIII